MADPISAAYADCIDHRCPRCHAEPGHWCINSVRKQPSAVPCVERYRIGHTTTPRKREPVSEVSDNLWGVHIQGMNDVLPALNRRDAHERAHKANTTAVWNETHREPKPSDSYMPTVWAVPAPYGPDSPLGTVSPYAGWTAGQIDDAWKRWAE